MVRARVGRTYKQRVAMQRFGLWLFGRTAYGFDINHAYWLTVDYNLAPEAVQAALSIRPDIELIPMNGLYMLPQAVKLPHNDGSRLYTPE
jgi:hypothetical protein